MAIDRAGLAEQSSPDALDAEPNLLIFIELKNAMTNEKQGAVKLRRS